MALKSNKISSKVLDSTSIIYTNEITRKINYFVYLKLYFKVMGVYLLNNESSGNKAVLEWCMKEGLIVKRVECSKRGCEMQLSEKPGRAEGYEWRCRKQGKLNAHDIKMKIIRDTWFKSSHLSILQILKISRLRYGRCMQDFVRVELGVHEHRIIDSYVFCREGHVVIMINESIPLGGMDVIVEIGESKFGTMKYRRGKPMDR